MQAACAPNAPKTVCAFVALDTPLGGRSASPLDRRLCAHVLAPWLFARLHSIQPPAHHNIAVMEPSQTLGRKQPMNDTLSTSAQLT
jgi:hypothetical protein